MRHSIVLAGLLALAGCVTPSPDQPASCLQAGTPRLQLDCAWKAYDVLQANALRYALQPYCPGEAAPGCAYRPALKAMADADRSAVSALDAAEAAPTDQAISGATASLTALRAILLTYGR